MFKSFRRVSRNHYGVTEIVGTMLLLGISISLFSVVYFSVLSTPAPTPTPSAQLVGSLDIHNNQIVFHHTGGEPISGNSRLLIHKGDSVNEVLLSSYIGEQWEMGETVTHPIYNINDTYLDAIIIDTDSNSIVSSAVLQKGYSTTNPYVKTITASNIQKKKATLEMGYDFVTSSGKLFFMYREHGSTDPWINTSLSDFKTGYGTFTQQITNLSIQQSYEFKAVMKNQSSHIFGNVLTFTTSSVSLNTKIDDLPEVITDSTFNISATGDNDLDNVTLFYRYSPDGVNWTTGDNDINWWDSDWSKRAKIRIDHEQVKGSLSDFPALIRVTHDDFSNHAQTDGDDFVFTDENNNILAHEIETYESSSGTLTAWVKLPTLSHTVDTNCWVYFGNPLCENQEQTENTWDNAFVSVYHLNDMLDSTIQNNTLTNENTNLNSGIVSNCRKFTGDDSSYLHVTSSDFDLSNEFTASCWYYSSSSPTDKQTQYATLLNKQDSSGRSSDRNWWLSFTEGQKFTWFKASSDGDSEYIEFDTGHKDVEDDSWHYATISYNATRGVAQIITDGGKYIATDSSLGFSLDGQGDPFFIGRGVGDNNRYFTGLIDEVRISDKQRDINWTNTCYNMIINQTSFSSIITSEDEGWMKWNNSLSNPDTEHQWYWKFPFSEFEGFYEFISIGSYQNSIESWPETADEHCQYVNN